MIYYRYFKIGLTRDAKYSEMSMCRIYCYALQFWAFPEFDVILYGTHTNSYSVARREILFETMT
jgi:hypothetical protein